MPIRAVIFDIGGVLLRTEDLSHQRWWEQRLGLRKGSFGEVFWNNPVSRRANIGLATRDEVWAEYARQFALKDDELANLQHDFFAGGVWDDRLIGYAGSLKPRYKTGIISNAWPDARQAVQEHVNRSVFDVIIFSAEVGLVKPDHAIYARALADLQVAPREAIFVDDIEKNVEAAQAIGMQGIRFESTSQVIDQIDDLLKG